MQKKIVWKPFKSSTPEAFEAWIGRMQYEPYVHDPVLQKIDWIGDLTKAIKKVAPLVGDGREIEYMYWNNLKSWEFMLNCFSILRAMGQLKIDEERVSWKNTVDQVRFWVDSSVNDSRFQGLFVSGAAFFYDMVQFFNDGRKLVEPKKLARDVRNCRE